MNYGINSTTVYRLKKGNIHAFEMVFDFYKSAIFKFVVGYTKAKETAEEITQETFIKLWEHKETLDPDKNIKSYLFTIAKNLTLNYLRSITHEITLKDELWDDIKTAQINAESQLIFDEYQDLFEDILNTLPEKKRAIFIMSKQDGMSNEEIALQLGITKKTVKNNLWETLVIIKKQLKPHLEFTLKTIVISYFFHLF
ncbi:RNA polymerase sigma factor [Zhouia sp. PK063]|uniref:RNA polymerase sigma factor n=1 Tax=Zhouia sp. PK063 TaxID=3373602 RepID=UPI0037B9C837